MKSQKKSNSTRKKSNDKKRRILKLVGLIFASMVLAWTTIFTGNQIAEYGVSDFLHIAVDHSSEIVDELDIQWSLNLDELDLSWTSSSEESDEQWIASIEDLEAYSGDAYVVLNDNVPLFTTEELVTTSYETYSELDNLGRVGVAEACIGTDLMPTEERGSISEVTPTGWVQASYDIVDAGWLYNRCHLIGWQLSGEDANEQNLITGTRYLNIEGMVELENLVAAYVKETGNHVMYRVTPHFEGDNLLANGLQIEAYSVEDEGEGICFYVYCYNVQPGISLDYATGENSEE